MEAAARRSNLWPWALMALGCVAVGGYALFHVGTGFAHVPKDMNRFPSPLGLELHIAASAVAILLGPWQFVRALRTRRPQIHRWMGRTYVLACTIGGAAGGSIAMFTPGGPIAGIGFLALAIC